MKLDIKKEKKTSMKIIELLQKLYLVQTITVHHEERTVRNVMNEYRTNDQEQTENVLVITLYLSQEKICVVQIYRRNYDLFIKYLQHLLHCNLRGSVFIEKINLEVSRLNSKVNNRKTILCYDTNNTIKTIKYLRQEFNLLKLNFNEQKHFILNEAIIRFIKGFVYSIYECKKNEEKGNISLSHYPEACRNQRGSTCQQKDVLRTRNLSRIVYKRKSEGFYFVTPKVRQERKSSFQEDSSNWRNKNINEKNTIELCFNGEIISIDLKDSCIFTVSYFIFSLNL